MGYGHQRAAYPFLDSCDGCFFQPLIVRKGVGNSPCCELIDDKFLFPCSKDIIYVKEEDNRNT